MISTNPMLVPNGIGKMHLSRASREHLENSLKNLTRGRAATPSFPLYGHTDVEVVKRFIHDQAGRHDVPDYILAYEEGRLSKFGPQGGYPAWSDLADLFLKYKTSHKPVGLVDQEVVNEMLSDYSQLRCSKYSVEGALEHLKKTDKIEDRAAGDPTFNLKKTDPEAQRIATMLARSGKWTSLSGYTFAKWQKQKPRIFMPMPFASMIVQAQYFIPFLGNIQRDLLEKGANSPFVAWADKIGMSQNCFPILEREIRTKLQNRTLVWYKTDFEKMDTHTASDQYEKFFIPMIQAAFGGQDKEAIRQAMLYTTTAPIISPSGTMTGDHGTASGAEVTNGGECCGNDYYQRRVLKLIRLAASAKHIKYDVITRRLNGDDGILVFALESDGEYETFKQVILESAERASNETQFVIQVEKQEVSKDYSTYCQYMLWWDGSRLHYAYPTALCLNSIINPMKEYTPKDWDKDYRDIDVIEKLDVCATHPWFHDLIKYVAKGMKFPLLGSTEKETARILSKYDKYRSMQSLGERYNRQDYDISNSPTVKFLLSSR